jgi:rhomboid protease GluP
VYDFSAAKPLQFSRLHWHWRRQRWQRRVAELFGDDRLPGQTLSVARVLIWINLLWFTLMILVGVTQGRGLQILMSPSVDLLLRFGAQLWQPLVLVYQQWWRCLTYAYTHGGLIHLAFNMVVLYQVGPLIEGEIGSLRFFTLYTFTALTATALGLLWHPGVPVVGASGSLFGLIGFAVAYYHRLGPQARPLRDFMFRWALFAFVFGLLVGADNAGHLGGALGGAIFGLAIPMGVRNRRLATPLFQILAGLSAVATLGSLALQGLIALLG